MSIPDKVKKIAKLIKRDGTKCHYCGIELNFTDPQDVNYRTIDHRYPLSKGGHSNPGNLVLSCHKCNVGKANRSYKAFKAQ